LLPHSGSWLAWLGGGPNDKSTLSQPVTIRANGKILSFHHWIASGDLCGHDFGRVLVNNTVVLQKDLCDATSMDGWQKVSVDLGAYAGQTVTLKFVSVTSSSINSNWFIDAVAFSAAATANDEVPSLPVAPGDGSETKGKQ